MSAPMPPDGSTANATLTGIGAKIDGWVYVIAKRWLAALIAYGAIVTVLPVLAPVLRGSRFSGVATPIYAAYSLICHQRDDRSIHLHGEKMAFCVRDFAIFAGAVGIALLYGVIRHYRPPRRINLWIAVALAIPLVVDGATQLVGIRESTWQLRAITGILFSAGFGWYLLPHLDAGFRSLRDDIDQRTSTA